METKSFTQNTSNFEVDLDHNELFENSEYLLPVIYNSSGFVC